MCPVYPPVSLVEKWSLPGELSLLSSHIIHSQARRKQARRRESNGYVVINKAFMNNSLNFAASRKQETTYWTRN
jgi:hypothetical protein